MKQITSQYSFNDKVLDWNNPNKTKKQKELLSSRGHILNVRIRLPLDLKIKMAQQRIRDAVYTFGEENCYVGFSGGKDSTVLSHLVTSLGFNLEHVYSNTRLEYPECISFAKEWCKQRKVKLTMLIPEASPVDIWKQHGYPMFSKEVSEILERIRVKNKVNPKKIKKVKRFLKYKHLHLSAKCCYYLKKKPLAEWRKVSGKSVAILGLRADESQIRRLTWVRKGCIYHTKDQVIVNPIIFFTDEDIYAYKKRYNLKFADIYHQGFKRNGCYCCGFGCHVAEENNFVKLKRYNPALWKNVMDYWGFREICKKCDTKIE